MGTMIAMVVALWGLLKSLALATVNYDDGSVFTVGTGFTTGPNPGLGRAGPPMFGGSAGRAQKVVTGTFSFDASYPTGGEDISHIFSLFGDKDLAAASRKTRILFEQPLSGAQTGKFAKVDYTAKKVQLFTNASPAVEVANASDQSAIAGLPFIAWGPR